MNHRANALISLAILSFSTCPSVADEFRVIAVSNPQGLGVAGQFSLVSSVGINNAGEVAFRGRIHLQDGQTANQSTRGMWVARGSQIQLQVLDNTAAPDSPDGALIARFDRSSGINDRGDIAFTASLQQGVGSVVRSNERALWVTELGIPRLLARSSFPAPGGPSGAVFDSVGTSSPKLNSDGNTAFNGSMQIGYGDVSGQNNRGIWTSSSGTLDLIAREGDQVPDLPSGYYYDIDIDPPHLGDGGHTVFLSSIRTDSAGVGQGTLVAIAAPGEVARTVIRTGDFAPGVAPEAVFESIEEVRTPNSMGEFLFEASLEVGMGGINPTNNQGVWLSGSDGIRLIARTGEHAPGTDGALFQSIGDTHFSKNRAPLITGRLREGTGQVSDQNSFGIWEEVSGELQLLARTGMPAPGTPDGTVFEDFFGYGRNSIGQFYILGRTRPAFGESPNSGWGYWAEDQQGILQSILQVGGEIELTPGDSRIVHSISSPVMNDSGQIAFSLTFNDGSNAIVVNNSVAIPEPTAATLACFVLAAAFGWRRSAG